MWVGVPEWRLPRDVITEEVEQILDLGIDIHYNTEIGKDIAFTDLVDDYDVGRDLGRVPDRAGDRHPGRAPERASSPVSASWKMSTSAQKDVWVGKQVVTVGGGFTSMDCVRTVMRMGAERSVMTYRRSIQEIPVEEIELEEAEIEGVEIMYMVSPTPGRRRRRWQCHRDRDDPQRARRARRQGRRRPEPVAGSEFIIECDMVISRHRPAAGQLLPGRRAAEPRPARGSPARSESAHRAAECLGGRRLCDQPDELHLLDRRRQAGRRSDRRADARHQPEVKRYRDHPGSDRVHLHAERAAFRGRRRVVDDAP